MQTKIYLNEWFLNAGIVGFQRILEHNNDNFLEVHDNYISFDTKKLNNFHKYYFNYFFDKYNVGNRIKDRVEGSCKRIKLYLNSKENPKQNKEKLKNEKKTLKTTIKNQMDKIKKYDKEIYQNISDNYNKIDDITEEADREILDDIQQNIIKEMQKDKINKKLTSNVFKNMLDTSYFGQKSFLNVKKNSLTYEEQEDLMYRDYISNIIETDFLQDIVDEKYATNDLESILKEKVENNLLSKEVTQIYSNILKRYIAKGKTLEDIKKYIQEKVFSYCYMCENDKTITSDYSEENFMPLALSSKNASNFFWNQNIKFPICDVCKLLLFCIPAGISSIPKATQENVNGQVVYREKEVNCFVNYDTSVEQLIRRNNYLSQSSKKDRTLNNPYADLILNIVEQERDISEWKLENIFVVEFEAEYRKFSRIEYFNIKRYMAKFFKKYARSTLGLINDYEYKLQIMDYILKNRDIKYIINERLREELVKEKRSGFNCYLATKTRLILNLLKKEEIEMDNIVKKNNDKLYVLYNLGVSIHKELKSKKEENKLDGYIYKMLNSIKAGNKKDFMDIVIRIHISMGKDVSQIFLEVMQNTDLDFESIGHSFIAGLISDKFEKKIEGGKENE